MTTGQNDRERWSDGAEFTPDGYVCERCGCTHYKKITGRGYCYSCSSCGHQQYLLAGTVFQDNKLPLYKLMSGLFLFFTANKGISAMEMRSHLDVNYKTALLLCRKCRILMSESTADKILDAMFYESDVTYIGDPSKEPGHRGMATEKQPFLVVLSTGQENRYPEYVRARPVAKDNSTNVNEQVYRYNHRKTGRNMMNKIAKYLRASSPMPQKAIIQSLDLEMASFMA